MEPNRTFKVLIVEDLQPLWEIYRKQFDIFERQDQEKYETYFAASVDEGVRQWHEHPDLDVITVDYELSPMGNWGTDLVDRIRPEFKGPMLATSSNPECNEKLMAKGCQYRAKDKTCVAYNVRQILHKMPESS